MVDLPTILKRELAAGQQRNPRYSLRSMAKRLDIGSSALSELMSGKRKVTPALAKRLINALHLQGEETERLQAMYAPFRLATLEGQRTAYTQIDMEHFRLLADWQHFAILSLAETVTYEPSVAFIARRLSLSAGAVDTAVARLIRLGYLTPELVLATPKAYATSDELVSKSIQQAHRGDLDLARASLADDRVEARDFSSITMAIDPKKLPEAKRLVREFRDRLCAYLESETKAEVFKLCIQLMPLSKS